MLLIDLGLTVSRTVVELGRFAGLRAQQRVIKSHREFALLLSAERKSLGRLGVPLPKTTPYTA
jgi:hypothetical protein